MKKGIALMLVLLSLAVLCAGCTTDSELQKVELHEVTRSVFYAPQYVAISMGFFEEEGFDVSITTSGGSDKAMTALLSARQTSASPGRKRACTSSTRARRITRSSSDS